MNRRSIQAACAAVMLAACCTTNVLVPAYANRPVTLIEPWASGGRANTVAGLLATGSDNEPKQPVNVVNYSGGGRVTGRSAIHTAALNGDNVGLPDITPERIEIISHVATNSCDITVKADGACKTATDVQVPMQELRIAPVWETSEHSKAIAGKFAETSGVLLKDLGLAP